MDLCCRWSAGSASRGRRCQSPAWSALPDIREVRFLGHHVEILLIMTFVRLDQTPGEYTIRISANVLPQKISGYAGQSHRFENSFSRALISIASPFIQATL